MKDRLFYYFSLCHTQDEMIDIGRLIYMAGTRQAEVALVMAGTNIKTQLPIFTNVQIFNVLTDLALSNAYCCDDHKAFTYNVN